MRYGIRSILISGVMMLGLLGTRYTRSAQAQDSSYQAISDDFFNILQQGKASDAVDYIFATNPEFKKKNSDQIEQLKTQFSSLGALMGSYVSRSKLVETKVAGMFVYQHYFVAYERQPISVRIKYYKPGTTWVCYGLQFDAEISDDIQKQADSKLPIDMK